MDWQEALLLLAIITILFGLIWLLSRYQMRSYRQYMNDHISETQKLADIQQQNFELLQRQAVALERIADRLDKNTG